jgi:hypothetical protein
MFVAFQATFRMSPLASPRVFYQTELKLDQRKGLQEKTYPEMVFAHPELSGLTAEND